MDIHSVFGNGIWNLLGIWEEEEEEEGGGRRIWNLGFGIWNLWRFVIWDLGLGFGIWGFACDLGFVCDL